MDLVLVWGLGQKMVRNFGLVKCKTGKKKKKKKALIFLNSQQFLIRHEIFIQPPCDFLFSFHLSFFPLFKENKNQAT